MRSQVLLAAAFLALPAGSSAAGDEVSVETIVHRAVERARWADEQGFESRYACRLLTGVEELDGAGEVEEEKTRTYELVRLDGHPYYRLVRVEGEPLDADERAKEAKREAEFRKKAAEGEVAEADSPDDDDDENIAFDEDLVARYDAELVGPDVVEGRQAWLVRYAPKATPLPEGKRIDKLLNRSRGRIWFDAKTFEVARVEFELTETLRFFWFLGSVSELSGYYVRRPVDGVWLPGEGAMTIHARKLLSGIRRRHTARWTQYRPFPELEAQVTAR